MTLFSSNPDFGEATEELPARYEGEPLNTGFNARYLLDVLASWMEKRLLADGHGAESLSDTRSRDTRVQVCGHADQDIDVNAVHSDAERSIDKAAVRSVRTRSLTPHDDECTVDQ